MKIRQITSTIALSSMLSITGAGMALADSAVIDTTGPSSVNNVNINNNENITQSNTNVVTVTNTNEQTATTGAANVSGNTNAGSATSGSASNNNTTTTAITIGNTPGFLAVGGSGGGTGGSGSPVGGLGGGSGVGAVGGLGGGSGTGTGVKSAGGLGAGGGVAVLPSVGCTYVCDVSALRDAYTAPADKSAVGQTRAASAALLGMAALLSLIGASGSAWYASRRAKA